MGSHHFLMWALNDYNGQHYDTLPACTMFMCNGDIMLHTNKGLIGARFDDIEDITIDTLSITHLSNESPMSSYACGTYEGPHDGGSRGGVELEGTMGTDTVAFSMYSGDAYFEGYNEISGIYSDFGSSMGMCFMDDANIHFDEDAEMDLSIGSIWSGTQLNEKTFKQLMEDNKYPYPNNFFECNILLDRDVNDRVSLTPIPPNGIDSIGCRQNVIAAKLDPVDELDLIEQAQDASKKNKNINFESVIRGRGDKTPKPAKTAKPTRTPKTERPTKSPRTQKPTMLKTPKPIKTPKTERPTKSPRPPKTPKPTKTPKTERPTRSPRTSKPTRGRAD